MTDKDYEELSRRAKKGWVTRRANQAKKKAQKAVQSEVKKEIKKSVPKKKGKIGGWGVNIFVSILAFIIGAVGAFFGYCMITKPLNDVYVSGDLNIHFLELGNIYTGDCTYIKAGDVDILIDAGSAESSAPAISNYINQYVTDGKLEYVIATHAHKDHIGAFLSTGSNGGGIFARYQVETIIDFPKTNQKLLTEKGNPTLYSKYLSARNAEVDAGAVHYNALDCYNNVGEAKRIWDLGFGIEMEILYNYYYDHPTSDENNYSVCLMINQGTKHFLFTGDLENESPDKAEEKLVTYYAENHDGLPHCEVYKGGHHGSKTSSSDALLNAITPEIVCVCCCAGTSEYTDDQPNQFPTQEFINRVAPHTEKVYVTTMVDNYVASGWSSNGTVKSMNGNIVVTSNSQGTTVNCSNNNIYLKDTDWFRENRTTPPAWQVAS